MIKHSRNIKDLRGKLRQFKKDAPRIVGIEAMNFIEENFRKQGFQDGSLQKWGKRKSNKNKRSETRALLVKSSRLKKSFRKKISSSRVEIINSTPYAKIHNEGGHVKGTRKIAAHSRRRRGKAHNVVSHNRKVDYKIPQRKFMGNSKTLSKRYNAKLLRRLKILLK